MNTFLGGERGNPGISKALVAAVAVAVVIVGVLSALVFFIPTTREKEQEILEGAILEGNPEFDNYTKEIIITNDPRRMRESRTAMGDVVMRLSGKIRNKGDKILSGLEVSVGMVDTNNRIIKEKRILFVPKHHPELKPNETIDVSVSIAGFRSGDDRANARWKVTAIKFGQ